MLLWELKEEVEHITPLSLLTRPHPREVIINNNESMTTNEQMMREFWETVLVVNPKDINSDEVCVVSDENIDTLITTAKREALREVQHSFMVNPIRSDDGVADYDFNMKLDDRLQQLLTHLESELTV